MNAAIVGCGLIGAKRARFMEGARLIACADEVSDRARALASAHSGVEPSDSWRSVVERKDVDMVIVCTRHDSLPVIALHAIQAGKHVLIEKPAARFSSELEPLIGAAAKSKVTVRVGFNHRYHPTFRKARELVDAGAIGSLLYIRARYGHGGRLGYEKEWRADPRLSGGGELIDQGVHLIDLSRWFLGDIVNVAGRALTCYWKMPVDDNAFMLLETADRKTAFLHASCTEWKNLFSFEIFGRDGKLEITGLGGSYGVEQLAFYKMLPQMGPPETTKWEFPMEDRSWALEFAEFIDDIRLGRPSVPGLSDAHATLRVVEQIYKESGYDHHA